LFIAKKRRYAVFHIFSALNLNHLFMNLFADIHEFSIFMAYMTQPKF